MVKVLVLGAAGYIGFAVAVALRREGHRVTGVVRNKDAEILLKKNEIIPVNAELKDIKTLQPHIESAAVIIDATSNHDITLATDFLQTVGNASKKSGIAKRYVYTSGILVYGDHKNEIVDETFAVPKSFSRAVIEKAVIEKAVISNKDVEGVVIRPAWIYGGDSGRYISPWFEPNSKGEIDIFGNPDKSYSWAHIEDLADAYVRVVGASKSLVAGEIFDVADDTRVTYATVKIAFARAAGVEGKVVYSPALEDAWSQVCESTVLVASQKIRKVLGWKPRHGAFLDNLDLYYLAYRAHNPKKSST